MRHAALLLPLAMLAACARPATPPTPPTAAETPAAVADEGVVWVQFTRKGEKGNTYNYGMVSAEALQRCTESPQLPALIHVRHLHWYDDVGVVLLEDRENDGSYYMRLDTLVAITVQRPNDIEELRAAERTADEARKTAREAKEHDQREQAADSTPTM